ncbi:MAG: hypothetical protein M3388_01350 [Acidobacteriota bacterium]|nr:hypothetical protein [Acidobacteriota bacterium]
MTKLFYHSSKPTARIQAARRSPTVEMTWGKTPRELTNETASVFCHHVH